MTKEKAKEIIEALQGCLDGNEFVISDGRYITKISKLGDKSCGSIYISKIYKVKQEPKYRPFTFDDNWKDYFRGRWVKNKTTKYEYFVFEFRDNPDVDVIRLSNNTYFSLIEMFEHFENLDGSPLGIEVKE